MEAIRAGNNLLGAVALSSLLLVCPLDANALAHVIGDAFWHRYGAAFATILLGAALVACMASLMAGKHSSEDRLVACAGKAACLAAVGYGLVLSLEWLEQGEGASAVLVIAAVLLGVGAVATVLVWAVSFAGMGINRAFAVFAGCFLAASLVRVILEGLPHSNAAVIYGAAALFGFCMVPVVDDWRRRQRGASANGDGSSPASTEERLLPSTPAKRRATIMALAPLFGGLAVLGLVVSLGANPAASPDWFSLGLIGASLVTVAALRWRKDDAGVFLARIVLPAVAVLFLAVSAAPLPALLQGRLSDALLYTVFGLTAIGALSFLCGIASARRMGVAALLAAAVFCATALGGVVAVLVLGWESGDNALVLGLALVVLMVATTLVLPSDKADSLHPAAAQPEGSRVDFEHVLDGTARRFSLTERERTVLSYLGRGYSAAHIAEQLGVNPSTVRTHCNNIYRKLGVNSREEILEFFDYQQGNLRP